MGAGFRNIVLLHENGFLRTERDRLELQLKDRLNVIESILHVYGDRAYGDPTQSKEEIERSIQVFFEREIEDARESSSVGELEREEIYEEGYDAGVNSVGSDD